MNKNVELQLTNDYIFKRLFSKKGNEDILKDLLEGILEIPIKEVEVMQEVELERVDIKDKLGVLDIKAIINENITVDIEMQIADEKNMIERIKNAPELFLVAVDKETGKIAGSLNGLATDEEVFRDEFFKDAYLNNSEGKNIMILGLSILPEYRRQGLARELVRQYALKEKKNNREKLILTCLDAKVPMYLDFGFTDHGISDSVWGGEVWHEMSLDIHKVC